MVSGWDESLETGNEMIDSQHRQLINLLEELKEEPKSDNEVLRTFDKMMEFTIDHFLLEEELMTEVNYPPDGTKTMVDQHKEFKSDVRIRVLVFRRGEKLNAPSLWISIENFLKNHEFGLDRELVEWIHREKETLRAA